MTGKWPKANYKSILILSPLTGEVIQLEQIPDQIFAEKRMGDGVAIKPSTGVLTAPFSGTVLHLVSSKHAIILEHPTGLQLLIHIGMNTVGLQGRGFTAYVASGEFVQAGQLLIEFDLEFLTASGYSLLTPIVIANENIEAYVECSYKSVKAGEPAMMEIFMRK
ncbi:MAG: glucose transporter subunit [Bacilli bacterium]|nr:glucose transporter subunit [Bacilli bacterium]